MIAIIDYDAGNIKSVQKAINLLGEETVLTIARTVDAKDSNTSQHSLRVSQYSVMIARKLGFNEKQIEELKNKKGVE